jgi:hypothetical protein
LAYAPKRCAGEGEVAVLEDKMNKGGFWTFFPFIVIVISIIGLALVPVMVIQPNLYLFQLAGQRSLIGALYCAVCVSGLLAVFYPSKCRGLFQHIPNPTAKAETFLNRLQIEGHHPSCQQFSGNRVTVGGRVFCAACSGLLVGVVFALIGSVFYFFGGLNVTWGGIWILVIGEVVMVLGLVQIKFGKFVKLILNVGLVVGSFAVLAVADSIGRSLFVDLYVLGLILFLLWFRISLSEWNNKQICRKCRNCFQ